MLNDHRERLMLAALLRVRYHLEELGKDELNTDQNESIGFALDYLNDALEEISGPTIPRRMEE